jgi:hypothetical protein
MALERAPLWEMLFFICQRNKGSSYEREKKMLSETGPVAL